MGNKLKDYINELQRLLNSEDELRNIEEIKKELLTEIQFWQHERLIHLLVTFLFAVLAVCMIVVMLVSVSIQSLILLAMFLVLLVPYIIHYYVLENGVQTLYVIYEELTRRQKNVPKEVVPRFNGVKEKK